MIDYNKHQLIIRKIVKMSNDRNTIRYVKHNKVRIKTDVNRDEITKMLLEFFEEIKEKSTGMKGFMVMDDLQDIQESVVLTFWERKEDMDCFYKPENKVLSDLVEKLNPSFEQLPVRKDYHVTKSKV
jgi:heme-degrading monooxygenase HmoA